jgi:hypothetical protein
MSEGHIVSADALLGWSYNDDLAEGDPILINGIALSEMALEFFRFLDQEIKRRVEDAGIWRHRVVCLNFQSRLVVLAPRQPASRDHAFIARTPAQHASSNDWREIFDDQGSPRRNAYRALEVIYDLFGLDASLSPLAADGQVSEAKLLEQQ